MCSCLIEYVSYSLLGLARKIGFSPWDKATASEASSGKQYCHINVWLRTDDLCTVLAVQCGGPLLGLNIPSPEEVPTD